jgi:sec-independent protein translocase protein TatA
VRSQESRHALLTLKLAWPKLFTGSSADLRRARNARRALGGVMGEFSIWHWLLFIAIALLLFGTSKFSAVGKGIGEGIRNFKAAMKEGEAPKKEKEEEKKS